MPACSSSQLCVLLYTTRGIIDGTAPFWNVCVIVMSVPVFCSRVMKLLVFGFIICVVVIKWMAVCKKKQKNSSSSSPQSQSPSSFLDTV